MRIPRKQVCSKILMALFVWVLLGFLSGGCHNNNNNNNNNCSPALAVAWTCPHRPLHPAIRFTRFVARQQDPSHFVLHHHHHHQKHHQKQQQQHHPALGQDGIVTPFYTRKATRLFASTQGSNNNNNNNNNELQQQQSLSSSSTTTTTTTSSQFVNLEECIQESMVKLKQVLEREYLSFFDPMKTEYYSPLVTFQDPLTSLSGVDAYKTNVDMLAGRTWLGAILFEDANINLHSITGGDVLVDASKSSSSTNNDNDNDNDNHAAAITISNIITRWTLRFTMKIWPWKPTARFSGISVYQIQPNNDGTVQITSQLDYWDSINLKPGGQYESVDIREALSDFIQQLKPGGFQASQAAPELPYSLLRRAKEYEVRKYPPYYAVRLQYDRRDEGFGTLGAFTSGTEPPLGPAIMTVVSTSSSSSSENCSHNNNNNIKSMEWPLTYAIPGSILAPEPSLALIKVQELPWKDTCEIVAVPAKVIAVAEFSDASLEPVVRKANQQLYESLQRDGLDAAGKDVENNKQGSVVTFAQYDAIFSMGKRRGEVWMELKDGGHPWC